MKPLGGWLSLIAFSDRPDTASSPVFIPLWSSVREPRDDGGDGVWIAASIDSVELLLGRLVWAVEVGELGRMGPKTGFECSSMNVLRSWLYTSFWTYIGNFQEGHTLFVHNAGYSLGGST